MTLDFTDDMDFSIFSDLFKDRHGFRPRGMTVEEMKAWMVSPGPLSSEEIRAAEEETRAFIEQCEEEERQYRADCLRRKEEFDFHPWQVQAGRLNIPEATILEY